MPEGAISHDCTELEGITDRVKARFSPGGVDGAGRSAIGGTGTEVGSGSSGCGLEISTMAVYSRWLRTRYATEDEGDEMRGGISKV